MMPSIYPNSILYVVPLVNAYAQEGDIIGYINNDHKMVAHRVLYIRNQGGETYYITRGDAHLFEESVPIKAAAYIVTRVSFGNFSYETTKGIGLLLKRRAIKRTILERKSIAFLCSTLRTILKVREHWRVITKRLVRYY